MVKDYSAALLLSKRCGSDPQSDCGRTPEPGDFAAALGETTKDLCDSLACMVQYGGQRLGIRV